MKKTAQLLLILCFTFCMGLQLHAVAEEIEIVGTGSGMAILEKLTEAYNKTNPGVTFKVPKSIGSGGGIKAVGSDQAIIGRVARKIKEKEKNYDLIYHPIAKMPIVFFVNKNVSVNNLTPEQICDIYTGKINNWVDVGGKDAKIRVIRREDGDSSLKVLRSMFPGFKDLVITKRSKTTLTDQETCQVTAEKDNTIAFGTYGDAKGVDVTIVGIDGKKPADSDYSYAGELALIFKEKNNTGKVKHFLSFIVTPEAHTAIKAGGGIPVQ